MRYENPLYLAEEAASLYQISGGRVALGVSRGAPEVADRGWEAFGYKGEAPNGADVARAHLEAFMAAVDGNGFATTETLGEIQADQISRYRAAWKEAGHDWTPRVSVSRSVFPIVDGADMQLFGMQASGSDQVGTLPDVGASTFGRTYAAEPDKLIDQLKADAAVMSADTLLITIPAGMGVDDNVKILDNFATHVAPPRWVGSRTAKARLPAIPSPNSRRSQTLRFNVSSVCFE